jgi:hypothetical protein
MIDFKASVGAIVCAMMLAACGGRFRLPWSSSPPPAPTPQPVQQVVTAPPPAAVVPAAPPPPATFVQSTSDIRATRIVDVRDGLTKVNAFRAATDLLTQRFSIDVSDQRAGFLMSPWQAGSTPSGAPDLRYRTRVVIRFLGEDWKQVSIRAEANWQKGEEWEIGYDGKILDELAVELKTKIGKR